MIGALLLLSMPKKVKEAWEQDWMETKLFELKHLLD